MSAPPNKGKGRASSVASGNSGGAGSQNSGNTRTTTQTTSDQSKSTIAELSVTDSTKVLLHQLKDHGVKASMDQVMSIWESAHSMFRGAVSKMAPGIKPNTVVKFLEVGNDGTTGRKAAGHAHVIRDHGSEFNDWTDEQIVELPRVAEHALPVGEQLAKKRKKGEGRPLFALVYYGKPLVTAIQISNNGFVVSYNRNSLDKALEQLRSPCEERKGLPMAADDGSMNFKDREQLVKYLQKYFSWPPVQSSAWPPVELATWPRIQATVPRPGSSSSASSGADSGASTVAIKAGTAGNHPRKK
ncbi:hypothetical protein N7462_010888 [Penicillium macrosclerotiorum]|uniref:uncharacterized protein n=1 Tax=Penicillium macrosclerotiorum TaxID=303699 RepID=UPI0025465C9A|nr:uncharacterized protein N7462_010888 [Penicillium macrosclerotiorum]KAJ5669818.1 hypothetical protein N7462_010888 [Penicillium macrosclerotiorum]